jgi:hypothetical protein
LRIFSYFRGFGVLGRSNDANTLDAMVVEVENVTIVDEIHQHRRRGAAARRL